jgi:multidrug efflux pump subunit AcrA (membrane-fusion protein)
VETRAELKRHLAEADQARASGALAQLEVAGARAAQAEARLARLQDLLAQAVAAAPFDGVVVDGERQVLQGAPVRKGDPLYRVARIEGLYATLLVPERDAALVTPGSTGALILVSRPDERIPLRVEAVIPVARTQGSEGNQFLVRAAFTGDVAPWWRPGMSGSARIDAGERRVIWILTHRLVDRLRLWLWW